MLLERRGCSRTLAHPSIHIYIYIYINELFTEMLLYPSWNFRSNTRYNTSVNMSEYKINNSNFVYFPLLLFLIKCMISQVSQLLLRSRIRYIPRQGSCLIFLFENICIKLIQSFRNESFFPRGRREEREREREREGEKATLLHYYLLYIFERYT